MALSRRIRRLANQPCRGHLLKTSSYFDLLRRLTSHGNTLLQLCMSLPFPLDLVGRADPNSLHGKLLHALFMCRKVNVRLLANLHVEITGTP
jgi:hypothetical protein